MAAKGLEKLLKDAQSKPTLRSSSSAKQRRPKRREISPAKRKQILETFQREQSAYRTHKLTGAAEQTVWRVLYESGYTEADLGRGITDQTVEKVLQRHNEGMGVRCIAGRYRLREETVEKIFQTENVQQD